jgi:hypothetical protein
MSKTVPVVGSMASAMLLACMVAVLTAVSHKSGLARIPEIGDFDDRISRYVLGRPASLFPMT